MELNPNTLFHNRYLLVQLMGRGASAEVWKAYDTTANNLVVAIKIFSENAGFDSYGFQNFEREFTTVFNLKHSNLLPPSSYDKCDGRPYLVMQFCQNGSASSLIGHATEADIIRLLHDVSGGLDYLHNHNIIHQDIKPDNILIDEGHNFMVTDFGISDQADSLASGRAVSGGTRGYMGPERTRGIVSNACDIWALGATAYEMATGNLPFGEHGGVAQFDATIPSSELKNLQPEVRQIIADCLQKDPAKRPTAHEIFQKTSTYLETGQWERASRRKYITLALTSLASVLMVVGIFLWDYNRVKVRYYTDYAEYYGVPKGVERISASEAAHRGESYRFETRRGKVQRLMHVNGHGKVVPYSDTENMIRRYPDTRFFYTDGGQIDYKEVYNSYGGLLFKLDYDAGMKTATLRQPDEYGSELCLPTNLNQIFGSNDNGVYVERSGISRYLLTFDDKGLLTKMMYAGYQNSPRHDASNIYGHAYKYNDKGLLVEDTFLNINGEPTSDHNGMSTRKMGYDNGLWTSLTYLNVDGGPSHDGNNCSLVKIDYDKHGNRIQERYYTLDGEPSIRTDINASGMQYELDEHGNIVKQMAIGVDGNPTYTNDGYCYFTKECNENGFETSVKFFDENGQPVMISQDGETYHEIRIVPDERNLYLEFSFYDTAGDPVPTTSGWHKRVNTHDSNGNLQTSRYFAIDGSPALINGTFSGEDYVYDDVNNMKKYTFVDADGKPVNAYGAVAMSTYDYSKSGAITKISYMDANGNLVLGNGRYAQETHSYDESGNRISINYLNPQGVLTNVAAGFGRQEYTYDPETNLLTATIYKRADGSVLRTEHNEYDKQGRPSKTWTTGSNGKLESGSQVVNYEYDSNNRIIHGWYTDLNGTPVNNQDGVGQYLYKYDKNGNMTEFTVLNAQGKPAVDKTKVHHQMREYDAQGRNVHEINYGIDGKPSSGANADPEKRFKYDSRGNVIETTYYDGYGNPTTSSDGYFRHVAVYNDRNQITEEHFEDTKGHLAMSKENQSAKSTAEYDEHGNMTLRQSFDANGNCTKIEKQKFNDKGQVTEYTITNGQGGPHPSSNFGRITVEYNETGVVPTFRHYFMYGGSEFGSERYLPETDEWILWKIQGIRVDRNGYPIN